MSGRRWLWLLVALVWGPVLGQQQPVVRVEVTPAEVLVGESAEMRVTVLVPTWFSKPPVFPAFEIANAIVRLPPDSSHPTNERIGDETWAGIVRYYRFYPLLGADFQLRDLAMQIEYANPGSQPVSAEVQLDDIEIKASVPRGAEKLDPYLAGTRLALTRTLEGDSESLAVGDALVVVYALELDGLPAMFLPPLLGDLQHPGAAIYADTPVVEDDATARRAEKLTYVFQSGGEFTLPGLELDWWNTDSGSIEQASLAPLSVAVAGPTTMPATGEQQPEISWPVLLAWFAAIAAGVLLIWRIGPRVVRWIRAVLLARRESEAYAFRQLLSALAHAEPRSAYHALLHWLERLSPGLDAHDFARRHGDDQLIAAIDALASAGYGDGQLQPDLPAMRSQLTTARRHLLAQRAREQRLDLPQLNP